MKFKYYITDISNGEVLGTNQEDVAKALAKSEEFFVVNSETGVWLLYDGRVEPVQETAHVVEEPDDEDEEDTDEDEDEDDSEDE